MTLPKIAVVQFRGIEGCGVTAYSRHMKAYCDSVGGTFELYSLKTEKIIGRPKTSKDIAYREFQWDEPFAPVAQEISREFDVCLIFSVPANGHDAGNRYVEEFINELTIPKWLVNHDHHKLSIARNPDFKRAIESCDGVLCHSLEPVPAGFLNWMEKNEVKPKRLEKLDIFFHVPFLEHLVNYDMPERKLMCAGRCALWKRNSLLMPLWEHSHKRGWVSEMIGFERSIQAVPMWDHWIKTIPFYLNVGREDLSFDLRRPSGTPHAHKTQEVFELLDRVGQSSDVFYSMGPYIYEEGMKRVARSAFSFAARTFEFNKLSYGNNPEFQALEAMLLSVCVHSKHFCTHTTLPGASAHLSETGTGVMIEDDNTKLELGGPAIKNPEEFLDELDRILDKEYVEYRKRSVDLVRKYYSTEAVIPAMMERITNCK